MRKIWPLCVLAAAAPATAQDGPWPVRWEVGDSFRYEWTYDWQEEAAASAGGEATSSDRVGFVALLAGEVAAREGGGVEIRLSCERIRAEATSPYGDRLWDSTDETEAEGLALGMKLMAEPLMTMDLVLVLDGQGRFVELTGNEHLDEPRSLPDSVAARIGADVNLVPALFPLFGFESAGERCVAVPVMGAGPARVLLDVCLEEAEEGHLEISGDTGARWWLPDDQPIPPEAPKIESASLEGELSLAGSRLRASVVERAVEQAIDMSRFEGSKIDTTWRRYRTRSRLNPENPTAAD